MLGWLRSGGASIAIGAVEVEGLSGHAEEAGELSHGGRSFVSFTTTGIRHGCEGATVVRECGRQVSSTLAGRWAGTPEVSVMTTPSQTGVLPLHDRRYRAHL